MVSRKRALARGERLLNPPHIQVEGPEPKVCPAGVQGLCCSQEDGLPKGHVPSCQGKSTCTNDGQGPYGSYTGEVWQVCKDYVADNQVLGQRCTWTV